MRMRAFDRIGSQTFDVIVDIQIEWHLIFPPWGVNAIFSISAITKPETCEPHNVENTMFHRSSTGIEILLIPNIQVSEYAI
jgi:hypothetical protein